MEVRRRAALVKEGVLPRAKSDASSDNSWLRLLTFIIGWLGFIFVFHSYREQALVDFGGLRASSYEPTEDLAHDYLASDQALRTKLEQLGQEDHVKKLQDAASSSLADLQSQLYYWKLDTLANSGLYRLPSAIGDKYILFATDCGGFNNIRMGFEHAVIMAWLTRRTLVLPPKAGWYLIDFGPFARMKPEPSADRVTGYGEFFDIEHLRAAVPVITTEEFRNREGLHLGLSQELMDLDLKTTEGINTWVQWLKRGEDDANRVNLPWAPLSNVVYYPSIEAVEAQFPEGVPKEFVHHRKRVEITSDIADKQLIVFPACRGEEFRYLCQVNTIVAFADEALSRSYKRMLRDNVHYQRIVFDIAARVIQKLGPFKYSALHVRRNDLQYKEVFIDASESLANIEALLHKGEPIYIATDEKRFDEFFRPFVEKGYPIFQWKDFFTERGGNVLSGVEIPRKLEGCIEQVICALGRVFAGTLESTFSSYIFRLRGYYHAPNTEIYFHNLRYSGDVRRDRVRTYSKKPIKGQIYKSEHPSIWEDAEAPHTTW
mmetsp:Transcript_4693/g.8826  ORF Transcript_4693/g.8826 Transcript_4693/m.8826 type:complete len:544 (+) Transcript_4693:89-1720(+)